MAKNPPLFGVALQAQAGERSPDAAAQAQAGGRSPDAAAPTRIPGGRLCRGLAALSLVALGCSSDPETSGSGTTTDTTSSSTTSSTDSTTSSVDCETDTATGDSDPNVLVGTFEVSLNEPKAAEGGNPETPGSTTVLGKVYDGPYPAQLVWEVDSTEGDCRLTKPRVPFCSTPCGGSAVCVEDETCQDYPKAHCAGIVTAKGLNTEDGESEIAMEPVAKNYQVPVGTTLKYPAFAEGDTIDVHASGDYFPAFDLSAKGIAQLVITSDTPDLVADQPVALAWTPAADPAASNVHVKLDISHHGGTKGMIECDTDDSGSVEISGALITKLLALGVSGFPTVKVTRSSTGSTTVPPGRVDLVIESSVERSVTIEGLISCTDTADCPQGQTCQDDLTCK